MPSLVLFTDYRQAQSPNTLTGPKQIKSAAQKTRYGWPILQRGKPAGAGIKLNGSNVIQEKVILSDKATFQTYTPDDPLTAVATQVTTMLQTQFCYAADSIRYTKQEMVHNGQSAEFSESTRSRMYYDFSTSLETALQVSVCNGMEGKLAAVPNPTTMEGASATEPYSLTSLINEFPSSLYVANSVSFGTKHLVNPAAANQLAFRNHVFGYNSTSVSPTSGDQNLLNALDVAAERLTYDKPSLSFDRASQNWESSGWPKNVCFWSYKGIEILKDLARQRNDTWTRTNELGVSNPMCNGMEMLSLPWLQTTAIYPTDAYTSNAAPVAEGGSTALGRGPRGYIVNTDSVHAVFNSEGNFARTEPRTLDSHPFTTVEWIDVWYQYLITKPWNCGVIAPGVVSGVFPSLTYVPDADVYGEY